MNHSAGGSSSNEGPDQNTSGLSIVRRPLSPHLQIYRFQLTSTLSILHRLSGMFLSLFVVGIIVFLSFLARGPKGYAAFMGLFDHVAMRSILFLGLFALMYHFWNGIRHLLWDMGWGLDLKTTYRTGWGVVFLTLGCVVVYAVWVLSLPESL